MIVDYLKMDTTRIKRDAWLSSFAFLTVGATFLLLALGGLVSSKGVGMAVPDWPTTFGYNMFTFPLSEMIGGIFYEHSHRLMGSLVGLLTIGLTLLIWLREERTWLKWLSVIALIAVILQGILGGLRVVQISTAFAVAHGAFAHAFFALIVSIALFLTDFWRRPESDHPIEVNRSFKTLTIVTSVIIYLQLMLGAVYRHTGELLWLHLFFAFVVTIMTFSLTDSVNKTINGIVFIKRISVALVTLLVFQLLTGMGAFMVKLFSPERLEAPPLVIAVTLIHVLTGATLFAASTVLTLSVLRVTNSSLEPVST